LCSTWRSGSETQSAYPPAKSRTPPGLSSMGGGSAWPQRRVRLRQRAQIHPRAVGKLHRVTICHELSDADQIIKFETVGQIDGLFYARERPRPRRTRETTPACPAWGEGRFAQTVCASRRPQCAGDAICRRCNSIAAGALDRLVSPARTVHPLGNESEGRLGRAL
jgi:hypothetical protein